MKNSKLSNKREQSGETMPTFTDNENLINCFKANAQYNDFRGAIAADGRDPENSKVLDRFLESKNVDTDRYVAVGFNIWLTEDSQSNLSIYCKDKQILGVLEEFYIEEPIPLGTLLGLFKRINIKAFCTEGLECELTSTHCQTI